MKLKSFSLAVIFLLTSTWSLFGVEFWIISGDWSYQVNADGGATIGNYLGSDTDVAIPSTLGGHTVTAIADETFQFDTFIETITIPDTVTSIGTRAFWECYHLTSITIPDSVTEIGGFAFGRCSALQSAQISSNITDLAEQVFQSCSSLASVNLPSNLRTIGPLAFWGCQALTAISIPASISAIDEAAFESCRGLTTIEIPENVTNIGTRAFAGCTNLTTAIFKGNAPSTFGDKVFAAGSPAFSIHYYMGKSGWTTPTWNGYQTLPVADIPIPTPPTFQETAPTITRNPASLQVDLYLPATFSVNATGSSPLSYQWFKNGAAISGATSSSYTIASVNENHAGNYYCRVSNNVANTNSATATLSVTSYNKVPLYRFSRNDNPSHFFTAVEEEKDIVLSELGDFFTLEGISHYVVAEQTLTAMPVYRMYNNLSGAHFYTASENEMQNVLATLDYFSLEGVAFYVFLWPEQGTLPVYRFYVPETGSHFFTISEEEKNFLVNSGQQTMVYEGIAWYAFPNP